MIEELKQQDGIPLNGFLKVSHNLDFELNPHSNRKYADYLNYGRDARLSLRYIIDQQLFIHVEATQQAVVEVAQSLAWLGCVLRTSQTNQIGRAQARICTREGAI